MIFDRVYEKPIITDNSVDQTDCYIVLSYAVKSDEPTLPTRALINEVKKRLKHNPNAYVIMSTGDNQFLGKTNARVMKEYGMRIGIPKDRILEEGMSTNTYENLVYSKRLMNQKGLKHLTIICLDLHTQRAVGIARKLGWNNFGWISVYSKGEPAYGYKWIQTYSRLTIFVYEVFATVYCKIRGEI